MPKATWKPAEGKELFAGPWIGEFGWELFAWQAKLRWLRRTRYEKVYVACKPGHEFLYQDFAHVNGFPSEFAAHHTVKNVDVCGAGRLPVSYNWSWGPNKLGWHNFFDQDWIPFGKEEPSGGPKPIVVHARNRQWRTDGNWNAERWAELVRNLLQVGHKVVQIGLHDQTIDLDCEDARGFTLKSLAHVLANARVIVGPSSGPLHFASLCKCPQVVFSDVVTNQARYTEHWNPFKTGAVLTDDWQPTVARVEALIGELAP